MRHPRRFVLALAAALSLASMPHAASAQAPAAPAAEPTSAESAKNAEEEARQYFQLGRVQYDNGAFREAATSFEHAYGLSKRDVLWYNIYLAYRDAGDNPKAAEALRNFLTRVPDVENRAQLESRLASLDRLVQEERSRAEEQARAEEQRKAAEAQANAQDAQASEAAVEQASSTPQTTESEPSLLPYVLMGVGGAMIVGSVVTGTMATSKHSELEEKCKGMNPCSKEFEPIAEEGKTLNLVTDVMLFGGIAVAGTGAVLWILEHVVNAPEDSAAATAAVGCAPSGCMGNVRISF